MTDTHREPPLRPRREDWPDLLANHERAFRRRGFEWGDNDCATYAAGWVQKLHGVDVMAKWRGAYASEQEFEDLVAQAGGLAEFVTAAAEAEGFFLVPTRFAQRGDIGLARVGNQECLGIVVNGGVSVPTLSGLALVPRGALRLAWGV